MRGLKLLISMFASANYLVDKAGPPPGSDGSQGIHLIGYEVASIELQPDLSAHREVIIVLDLDGTLLEATDEETLRSDEARYASSL